MIHSYTLLLNLFLLWQLRVLYDQCVGTFNVAPFLRTSLYSVTTRCSRTILYFPCSNSEINQFSIEPWSSCCKIVVRNQDIGSRYAYCCRGITTLNPSQYIALESICMLTNLCMNTYLYIFISESAYLCLFIHYM